MIILDTVKLPTSKGSNEIHRGLGSLVATTELGVCRTGAAAEGLVCTNRRVGHLVFLRSFLFVLELQGRLAYTLLPQGASSPLASLIIANIFPEAVRSAGINSGQEAAWRIQFAPSKHDFQCDNGLLLFASLLIALFVLLNEVAEGKVALHGRKAVRSGEKTSKQ